MYDYCSGASHDVNVPLLSISPSSQLDVEPPLSHGQFACLIHLVLLN